MTIQPSEMTLVVPTGPGADVDDEFATASKSQARQALDRFTHSWLSVISLGIFVLIIAIAFIAPQFYKWKYGTPDPKALSVRPGQQGHVLGTDETGFDELARMMRGTQRDVLIIAISTSVALFLGITIGALAGYYSKFVDNLLMRFVDIMLTVPYLVILILACARYPSTAGTAQGIGLLFGLFGWMGLSRLVRAQFLSLKEREFVEAAHAMGASNFRIIFRHLIPNALGTILVFATLFAATSIVAETSITYLGYGVKTPDTSLGLLVSNGVDAINTRPWLFYYPGLLILIIVLATNLVGEGIRNAFDPRNNRVRD
ncbi:MAG: glutathione transport system permease protein [Pseudonocardiales bacterium]|jgi:peptide/nickel transport system permease protein|nr:glutathione transport system permease protein [Pseudonocardiales bacterium]